MWYRNASMREPTSNITERLAVNEGPVDEPLETTTGDVSGEQTPSRLQLLRRIGRGAVLGATLYLAPAIVAGVSGQLPSPSEKFGPMTVTIEAETNMHSTTRLSTLVGDQQLDEHYGYGINANISEIDIEKVESAARTSTPLETITNSITRDRNEIVFDQFGIQLSREDRLKLRFATELLFTIGASTAVAAFAAGEFARRKFGHERSAPIWKALGMGSLAIGLTVAGFTARDTEKVGRSGLFAYVADRQDVAKKLDSFDSKYGHTAASSLALVDSIIKQDTLPYDTPSMCIIAVSDRHQRDILPLVNEYVRLNECVAAVIDGGDQVDWGQPFENDAIRTPDGIAYRALSMKIRDLGVPYYVVKGNHDNASTMQAIADSGAIELDGQVQRVEDLVIVGEGRLNRGNNADLFTPAMEGAASQTDSPQFNKYISAQEKLGKELVRDVRKVEPDIAMVHFPRAAAMTYGLAPIVVSGHMHVQKIKTIDKKDGHSVQTTHVQVGSTGGAGLRAADHGHPQPQEFVILKFDQYCQFIGGTSLRFDSLGDGSRSATDFWNDEYSKKVDGDRSCISPRLKEK